jgi:hypothetical protein
LTKFQANTRFGPLGMGEVLLGPDEFPNLRIGLNVSEQLTLAELLPEFRQRR